MRITGGAARGVPLRLPKGDTVRPATDALRQAVFSCVAAWVPGARFLDLFAGSGAYGLEAFSRGATGGAFVERHPPAVACLRENLAAVARSAGRPAAGLTVLPVDATGAGWEAVAAVDLVFIDPPYEMIGAVAPGLFARLSASLAAVADPVVVFELPGALELRPAGWRCVKRLGKGARQPTAAVFRRA